MSRDRLCWFQGFRARVLAEMLSEQRYLFDHIAGTAYNGRGMALVYGLGPGSFALIVKYSAIARWGLSQSTCILHVKAALQQVLKKGWTQTFRSDVLKEVGPIRP